MKHILSLIFLVCFVTNGLAQSEFNAKYKAIPPVQFPVQPKNTTSLSNFPKIETPNIFKSPEISAPTSVFNIRESSTINMTAKNQFMNPGDVYKEKLNEKNRSSEDSENIVYRKNQYFGDFRSKSLTAKVMYRDAAQVDGDLIRVYLNGMVIQSQVFLDNEFKGFEITLEMGFNKIDFEALNQGSSGPNTAEFKVYDDKGILISASQWNLGTGFKATIIIVKE